MDDDFRHDLGCPVMAGGDGFCTCDEPTDPGLPLTTGEGNTAEHRVTGPRADFWLKH